MPEKPLLPYPFLTREMFDFAHASTFALQLQVVAGSTQPIEIRGFTKAGPFTFSVTPLGDGSVESFTLSVPDIPIAVSVTLSLDAVSNVVAYTVLHLLLNGNRTIILASGIVSRLFGISFPYSPQNEAAQIHGIFEEQQLADPAAGAEISIEVPQNEIWELTGFKATLTASSDAANRVPAISAETFAGYWLIRKSATNITATQEVRVLGIAGGTTGVITANSIHEIGLPQQVLLAGGGLIETSTAALDDGDQWSNVSVTYRKWYQPGE